MVLVCNKCNPKEWAYDDDIFVLAKYSPSSGWSTVRDINRSVTGSLNEWVNKHSHSSDMHGIDFRMEYEQDGNG